MAAHVLASGCTELRETSIEIETGACRMPDTSIMMNTYVVQLFESPSNAVGTMCTDCSRMSCPLVDQQCACGPNVPTDVDQLSTHLRGLRFANVDAGQGYCIRLVALELAPSSTTGPCECPIDWEATTATTGRACGVSDVGFANEETAIPIGSLACKGDDESSLMGCLARFSGAPGR